MENIVTRVKKIVLVVTENYEEACDTVTSAIKNGSATPEAYEHLMKNQAAYEVAKQLEDVVKWLSENTEVSEPQIVQEFKDFIQRGLLTPAQHSTSAMSNLYAEMVSDEWKRVYSRLFVTFR